MYEIDSVNHRSPDGCSDGSSDHGNHSQEKDISFPDSHRGLQAHTVGLIVSEDKRKYDKVNNILIYVLPNHLFEGTLDLLTSLDRMHLLVYDVLNKGFVKVIINVKELLEVKLLF